VRFFFATHSSSLEVVIDKLRFTHVSSSQLETQDHLSSPSESNRISRPASEQPTGLELHRLEISVQSRSTAIVNIVP